ncbi:MAG TPA: hypothetical protein VJS11_07865 [Acidobacteriaceae bacterium]|nr:hypothetical protein [Acidobacteriaceae bacterium]
MKSRLLLFAALAGMTFAAVAQSTPPQQDQQKSQNSQTSSGVSQPPPDATIQADEDVTNPPPPPTASVPTPPPPASTAKPSAAIPATTAPKPVTSATAPAPAAKPTTHSGYFGEIDNTDDGIVTVGGNPAAPAAPAFHPRETTDSGDASDFGVVTYVPFNPNDLRSGTNISVRLKESLSTARTEAGAPFTATVRMDVYNDNTVVIPAGSELRGRVLHVSQGHHFGLHASMRLHADTIVLPDGTSYHVDADVIESYAPGTDANDEGSVVASTHYTKDAIQYGGAVGTGAVVGGAVAGPVGAGAGALVGAGAETTHLLLQSPSAANLPKGAVLIFCLNEPMHLTPAKN